MAMPELDPAALDRYITGGHYSALPADVWCWNSECANYGEPVSVTYASEYGQGWYEPEECPQCGYEWHEEPPPEDDDDA